jgi:signal transduction histidine kinase
MRITATSQQCNDLSHNLESVTSNTDGSIATLGAELEYKQDGTGRYLSFYWLQCQRLGINPAQIVGDWEREPDGFVPVDKVAYLHLLQRILTTLIPERYQCWFSYRQQFFELELIISPIIPANGCAVTTVFVMGRLLQGPVGKQEVSVTSGTPTDLLAGRVEQHRKTINQITRNIRRTLDLDIIWQQTVDCLGAALSVKRCIICPYHKSSSTVQVVAEYHQPSLTSMLGAEIEITTEPAFAQAISTLEPISTAEPVHLQLQQQKILVVATCHQDVPNALIAISLLDECEPLIPAELELAKEVADQLGTAIAHATLYKELEEARQQAEAATQRKTDFLANMSHEIRTPLNGMIGFLRLVLDGMVDDPEEQNNFIQEAHKSSLHLLEIINDILDIAKIEAGKMDFDLRTLKLDDLFDDVKNFMGPQAEQKQLTFQMVLPDTPDEIIIHGDYQRLKQVMLNLLGNAIKFTHDGGIEVTADLVKKKVTLQDKEFPGMVRVRVADTGIGVSLDKQDKLFQLFSQVDSSRTRQYGGTGLGLAISQKLVEAMGGEVHFYSLGDGLGSTVTFTVPLYQQPVIVSG